MRRTPWRSWLGCIGVLLVLPQLGSAQEPAAGATGGVGTLSSRDERFRGRLSQLLLSVPTRDLAAGWQLAAELGPAAAPMLWELLQAERSNVGRRLGVLAAAVLAGGPGEDERLFAWLAQPNPMPEERVLAMVLLAHGPRRTRPVPEFWQRCLGPTKTPEQIMSIAVRLAAARFPGTDAGAPLGLEDDPGVAAAAAFAGLPVPASVAARLWNLKAPERHAELFWRGALLGGTRQRGEGVTTPEALRDRAAEVLQLVGDQYAAARAAATLFQVRIGDIRSEGARPDWRLLQLAASSSASATVLQGWLGAVPSPRDEEPQRLAVCYVLSRPPTVVIAERAAWGQDARIQRHVAIALAWRLLGEERPQPVSALMPGLPEWFFVRWASGESAGRDGAMADAQLDTTARLAAADRLPREAAQKALEEALWRWGSHPGLGQLEQERIFLRDLLLVGSHQGGGKYVPHVRPEHRYRPTGMEPAHPFFDVAVALHDFLARPRSPMPPEYRLR